MESLFLCDITVGNFSGHKTIKGHVQSEGEIYNKTDWEVSSRFFSFSLYVLRQS